MAHMTSAAKWFMPALTIMKTCDSNTSASLTAVLASSSIRKGSASEAYTSKNVSNRTTQLQLSTQMSSA